jgi:hypothetical protein
MMKNRCLNPRAKDFRYYGTRGITVEASWLNFDAFIRDMGLKPTPLHTIERRSGAGLYCKENCYWATRKEQARNRSYCKLSVDDAAEIRALYETEKITQVQLGALFGVSQTSVSQVIRGISWCES